MDSETGPAGMPGLHGGRFRILEFLVEPQRNCITGPDGAVSLQPKIIDVLCALADRQGQVLSREALIDQIWGVEFGADESLTRAISQLRKVFGDTRGEPRIIETIAKRGYRLVAPVVPAGAELPDRDRDSLAVTPIRHHRGMALLAGLLFLLAAGGAYWWFAQDHAPVQSARTGIVVSVTPFTSDGSLPAAGFSEALSAAIARSPLVRVRPENALGQAADSGDFAYRLRGNVRRIGDRVRIEIQLLDSASGDLVWSEGYERPFDTSFSVREEIVGTIGGELLLPLLSAVKAKLLRRPILTLAPWQLTLLVTWVPGTEARPTGPPVEDSYWLQRRALEIDSDFAPAHALYAELAFYHLLFHPPWNTPSRLAEARRHAERAIELAPYDAEVLYQVALSYRFAGDRNRAAAMLARVLELQPDHPLARIDLDFVEGQCGPGAEAAMKRLVAHTARLSTSNPARWVALAHLSALRLGVGDYAGARDAASRARRIVPVTWTAMTLAAADAELGLRDEAAQVLAEHRREWPDMDIGYFAEHIVPRWCLGGARTPEIQAVFRRLAASVAPPPRPKS
jgi:DNA-binding winged helix-turn-helix (wHTH) protein/TolB-like protein